MNSSAQDNFEVFYKNTGEWSNFNKAHFKLQLPPADRNECYYLIRKNSLHGYIDHNGEIIFHPQFDSGLPFSEGLAIVEKENRWAIIDMNRKITWIKTACHSFSSFKNGLAIAEMDMRGELADYEKSEHKETIKRLNPDSENEYQMMEVFYGIVDRYGNELVPVKYYIPEKDAWIGNFLYYYDEWRHEGIIGIDGNIKLPCIYKSIEITAEKYILAYRKLEEKYFEICNNKLVEITQEQYGKGISNITKERKQSSSDRSNDDLPF